MIASVVFGIARAVVDVPRRGARPLGLRVGRRGRRRLRRDAVAADGDAARRDLARRRNPTATAPPARSAGCGPRGDHRDGARSDGAHDRARDHRVPGVGRAQTVAVQSPTAVLGIVLAFSVVPAAIIALSLIPFARYRLRKTDIVADAVSERVGHRAGRHPRPGCRRCATPTHRRTAAACSPTSTTRGSPSSTSWPPPRCSPCSR